MSNISDKNLQFITEWKETLPDYAKDFITLKSKTSAISTIRIYVNNIKIFLKWRFENGFDDSLIDTCAVTTEECNAFVKHMLKRSAVPTVLSVLSTLSSLYNMFVDEGYITINPFIEIKRPIPDKTEPIKLTNDDKCALLHVINTGENLSRRFLAQELSHCTRYRNRSIMKILFETDMKVSEIAGLDVKDISIANKTICVRVRHGNNNDKRYLNVSQDTINTIKECINMRRLMNVSADEPALFIASQGKNKNKRISTQTIDGLVKKYAIAAGIDNAERISPNTFRTINLMGG